MPLPCETSSPPRVGEADGEVEHLVDDRTLRRSLEGLEHLVGHREERLAQDVRREPVAHASSSITRFDELVHGHRLPGQDEHRGGRLLDDAGPGEPIAGVERSAFDDRRPAAPRRARRGRRRAAGAREPASASVGPLDRFAARRRDAHARLDDLDRGGEAERVRLLGGGVESLSQALEEVVVDRPVAERHLERVLLADVPQAGRTARRDARRPRVRARRAASTSSASNSGPRTDGSSGPTCVRTASARRSPSSIPSAEKWPGAGGITVRATPSSRASSAACSGPAPPNATSAKSRGSWPRRSVTSRSAWNICASTYRRTPRAAVAASTPSRPAEPRQAPMRRVDVERHRAAEEVRRGRAARRRGSRR